MRCVSAFVIGTVLFPAVCLAQSAFQLDANGRTMRVASHVSWFGTFRIDMPAPQLVRLCGGQFTPGGLVLRSEQHREVVDPYVIAFTVNQTPHQDAGFRLNPDGAGFLVYNIQQLAVKDPGALKTCGELIETKREREAGLKGDVESAEREVAEAEMRVARLSDELKSRQQDAASYAGIPGTTTEVAAALKLVAQTRVSLQAEQKALDTAQNTLRIAKVTLADFPDEVRKELEAPLEQAEYLFAMLTRGAIIKVGGIFVAGGREGVFYDFSTRPVNSTLQLQPLASIRRSHMAKRSSPSLPTSTPSVTPTHSVYRRPFPRAARSTPSR